MYDVMQVMDAQALVGIVNLTHLLGLTPFMKWVSSNGECWIALGVVLLFFRRTRWMGVGILLALALSAVVGTLGLKEFFARPRPCTVWMPEFLHKCPKSFSFPSGHTTAAFTVAGVLWYMRAKYWGVVLVGALLMGLSRMALFAHYPTDVLGGVLLGLACGILVGWFVDFFAHAVPRPARS